MERDGTGGFAGLETARGWHSGLRVFRPRVEYVLLDMQKSLISMAKPGCPVMKEEESDRIQRERERDSTNTKLLSISKHFEACLSILQFRCKTEDI